MNRPLAFSALVFGYFQFREESAEEIVDPISEVEMPVQPNSSLSTGNDEYVATTEDGLNFEEGRQFTNDEFLGEGIVLSDGTQRRYSIDIDAGMVTSDSSIDGGETWEDDEGYRYDLNEYDDGRVRLIVMYEEYEAAKPPKGRLGELYTFISEDGENFELESKVVSWDLITEFEVRSLNDPKIMQFEDGTFRVYVAAMVPDEEAQLNDDPNSAYKWVLLSLTGEDV
ncbi:MAG: hypothetical protein Q8P27_00720 [Candidatus Peregrinibacteria bacterium]|nr:hypothetical protein [Candidatus Peregrinibacteria bacterium]